MEVTVFGSYGSDALCLQMWFLKSSVVTFSNKTGKKIPKNDPMYSIFRPFHTKCDKMLNRNNWFLCSYSQHLLTILCCKEHFCVEYFLFHLVWKHTDQKYLYNIDCTLCSEAVPEPTIRPTETGPSTTGSETQDHQLGPVVLCLTQLFGNFKVTLNDPQAKPSKPNLFKQNELESCISSRNYMRLKKY